MEVLKKMNTYKKFGPNVFVASCDDKYEKGDVITVETRHENEHECVVWNYLGERNGKHLHSITRVDGFNSRKRIENKLEKTKQYQSNAMKRSNDYSQLSNQDSEFLSLGEPIKVGHHSEKRHRKLIEKACNRANRASEEYKKAKRYDDKIDSLSRRVNNVDLSMPESLEYYKEKLEKAVIYHKKLKSGEIEKEHDYSMQYALQNVKKLKKKVELATQLWA